MTRERKSSKEPAGSDRDKHRSSSAGGTSRSGRVEKTHATKSSSDRKSESLKSKLAAKGIKYDSNHSSKEEKESVKTEKSETEKNEDVYRQKMTITPDPERKCIESEIDQIKEALVDALEPLEDGCYPQFYSSHSIKGVLLLTCANEQTKQWLEKTVPHLQPWKGAKLCAKPKGVNAGGPKVMLKTPKLFAKTDPKKILQMLGTQNKTLLTGNWKNVSVKSESSGQTLVYAVDDQSLEAIRAMDNKAYLGLGNVELVILKNEEDGKKTSEDTQTKNDEGAEKRASADKDTKNEESDNKSS